ncbi:hypothetical protein StoSoilB22_18280 [Arthrobacter sp. StoSoilB22]|nr:hypothetical protein StoSoilB22_18280 [Arthrobacter sp. StoSoilB22]
MFEQQQAQRQGCGQGDVLWAASAQQYQGGTGGLFYGGHAVLEACTVGDGSGNNRPKFTTPAPSASSCAVCTTERISARRGLRGDAEVMRTFALSWSR